MYKQAAWTEMKGMLSAKHRYILEKMCKRTY